MWRDATTLAPITPNIIEHMGIGRDEIGQARCISEAHKDLLSWDATVLTLTPHGCWLSANHPLNSDRVPGDRSVRLNGTHGELQGSRLSAARSSAFQLLRLHRIRGINICTMYNSGASCGAQEEILSSDVLVSAPLPPWSRCDMDQHRSFRHSSDVYKDLAHTPATSPLRGKCFLSIILQKQHMLLFASARNDRMWWRCQRLSLPLMLCANCVS